MVGQQSLREDHGSGGMAEPQDIPEPRPVLTGPIDVMIHQCSMCRYASTRRHHVVRHVGTRCPGAVVWSGEIAMCPVDARASDHSVGVGIAGDHNSNNTINNVTNVFVIPVGTDEEAEALQSVFQDKLNLRLISRCEPAEIPSKIFELTRGVNHPRGIRNVAVEGTRVLETRSGGKTVAVPRSKYVRRAVDEMTKMCRATEPDDTPDPGAMVQIRCKMMTDRYKAGKRTRASPETVVAMVAAGDHKAMAKLDLPGHTFARDVQSNVDKQLDRLAARGSSPGIMCE